MNKLIILCVVLVIAATVHAADDGLLEQATQIAKECAAENKISDDELVKLRSPDYDVNVEAAQNVKCFTKCANLKSGIFSDEGVDVERFVKIGVVHGVPEATVRATIETCKEDYKDNHKDCDLAWKGFVCTYKLAHAKKEENKE